MQDIVMSLVNDNSQVEYYCVIDNNKLYVLTKKSLEKRVFWNEFKDYEFKNKQILRVNNYKDNVLSRLLGTSQKSDVSFSTNNEIGISKLDYFQYGGVCISLQQVYQEGLLYTGDFTTVCTDSTCLYNFYNYIKDNALVYESSPYHLRFRCSIEYLKNEVVIPYFLSVDYFSSVMDSTFSGDKDIMRKYISYLGVFCTIHNEDIFVMNYKV